MSAHIDVCMGGRVAEEIIFGADQVRAWPSSPLRHFVASKIFVGERVVGTPSASSVQQTVPGVFLKLLCSPAHLNIHAWTCASVHACCIASGRDLNQERIETVKTCERPNQEKGKLCNSNTLHKHCRLIPQHGYLETCIVCAGDVGCTQ